MICVKSDLASAAVILAHPDYCEDELGKQLAEVNKRGYDIRHLISLS